MNNEPNQITFDELYAQQERITKASLAQQIRLSQWRDNGIIYDNPYQALVGQLQSQKPGTLFGRNLQPRHSVDS